MKLYHFTTSLHLPWILNAGELQPGRGKSFVAGLPDPDFLWASSDERGEPTASGSKRAYRSGEIQLVRIALDASMFFPWAEARQRHPDWTDEHVRILNESGRIVGSNPETWFCRMGSISLSDCPDLEIHTKSFQSGRWAAHTIKPVAPIVREGITWRGVYINGRGYASAQQTHPDGGRAYMFGRIAA